MSGKITVVVGGQFGSEAKGAVCAYLARTSRYHLTAVRVAGPNAGHTAYDSQGRKFSFRSLPVAAVVRPDADLLVAPGSEVQESVLLAEIREADEAGHQASPRVMVDPQASWLAPENILGERGMSDRLGSTGKGIGDCRAGRIMRTGGLYGDCGQLPTVDVAHLLSQRLQAGQEIQIEGTQGFGLGLHAGYYPFCTSSDCRAVDFLGMAGISPWGSHQKLSLDVWVTYRTYPIRVAGNSGPLRGERTWDEMSKLVGKRIEPERTTVTKKVRRIGEWDTDLAQRALRANGGPSPEVHAALMFVDYLDPAVEGACEYDQLTDRALTGIAEREKQLGVRFELLGTGPQTIIDRRFDHDNSNDRRIV